MAINKRGCNFVVVSGFAIYGAAGICFKEQIVGGV